MDRQFTNGHHRSNTNGRWPKQVPTLTPDQEHIRDEFMKQWLHTLPQRYRLMEWFNHTYPLRSLIPEGKTLEIGAGTGTHLSYEDLSCQDYTALELRPELEDVLRARFPKVHTVIADCQSRLGFPDGFFDRIIAVHVLEHLPNLPAALDEIHRLVRPGGLFSVVIPCEGGHAYTFARNISARRLFEQQFKQSYDWFVACEHINLPHEILPELLARFRCRHSRYFPLFVPIVNLNLAIGMTLVRD